MDVGAIQSLDYWNKAETHSLNWSDGRIHKETGIVRHMMVLIGEVSIYVRIFRLAKEECSGDGCAFVQGRTESSSVSLWYALEELRNCLPMVKQIPIMQV